MDTDIIYPSTRFLQTFLFKKNRSLRHKKNLIRKKNMPKFFVLTCKKTSLILRCLINTKPNENLMNLTKSNDSDLAKTE